MVNNLVGGWPSPPKNHRQLVTWDDDIPFPTFHGKSFKIPWFQSPPTRYCLMIGCPNLTTMAFMPGTGTESQVTCDGFGAANGFCSGEKQGIPPRISPKMWWIFSAIWENMWTKNGPFPLLPFFFADIDTPNQTGWCWICTKYVRLWDCGWLEHPPFLPWI